MSEGANESSRSDAESRPEGKLALRLLQMIQRQGRGATFGNGQFSVFQQTIIQNPELQAIPKHQEMIFEVFYSLLARELVYIFADGQPMDLWKVRLTERGRDVASDPDVNPDSGSIYVETVRARIPDASDVVLQYLIEGHRSYENRCHFACAVMVGVASEAAFYEMAPSFGAWLQETERRAFLTKLGGISSYAVKFDEFRRRIDGKKDRLPPELSDSLNLTLNAVLEALRLYRNDAGHPRGKTIDRETAFLILQITPKYLQKMYALKQFFDQEVALR